MYCKPFILFLSLLPSSLLAQVNGIKGQATHPFFPGGMDSLQRFIFDHVKYSDSLRDKSVEGSVYASFIVEANGMIDKIIIEKGPPSPGLDSATIACIKAMPRWVPAKINGEPTPMRMLLPVSFPPGSQLYNVPPNTIIK